jgi:hypothetical protein
MSKTTAEIKEVCAAVAGQLGEDPAFVERVYRIIGLSAQVSAAQRLAIRGEPGPWWCR